MENKNMDNFNEDDIISIKTVSTKTVYSESAYKKLEVQRDQFKKALEIYANKKNWRRNENGWMNIFKKDTNGPAIAIFTLLIKEEENERGK